MSPDSTELETKEGQESALLRILAEKARELRDQVRTGQSFDISRVESSEDETVLNLPSLVAKIVIDRLAWRRYSSATGVIQQINESTYPNSLDDAEVEWYQVIPVITVPDDFFNARELIGADGFYTSDMLDLSQGHYMPVIFIRAGAIEEWRLVNPSREDYRQSIIEHEYAHYIHESYIRTFENEEYSPYRIISEIPDLILSGEIGVLKLKIKSFVNIRTLDELRSHLVVENLRNSLRTEHVSDSILEVIPLSQYMKDSEGIYYNYLKDLLDDARINQLNTNNDNMISRIESEYEQEVVALAQALQHAYSLSLIAGQWNSEWNSNSVIEVLDFILLTSTSLAEAIVRIKGFSQSPSAETNQQVLTLLRTGSLEKRPLIDRLLSSSPQAWKQIIDESSEH